MPLEVVMPEETVEAPKRRGRPPKQQKTLDVGGRCLEIINQWDWACTPTITIEDKLIGDDAKGGGSKFNNCSGII